MSAWAQSATVLGCSSGDSVPLSSLLAGSRNIVLTFVGSECAGRDLTVVRAIDALAAAACDRAGAQALRQVIFGLSTASASSKAVVGRVCEECPNSYISLGDAAPVADWCGLGRVAALPEAILCDVVSLGEGAAVRVQPRYTEMGADLKVNPQSAAFAAERFPASWPRNCAQVRVARQELGLSRRVVHPPSSGSAAGACGGDGPDSITEAAADALPALPFFAAHMAPDALLQLPFYSGDPVLVKRIGDSLLSSATAAVAPAGAAGAGSAAGASAAASAAPGPAAAARPKAALRSLVVYMCPPPEVVDEDNDGHADAAERSGAAGGAGGAGSGATAAASAAAAAAASPPVADAPALLLAPSVCADLGLSDGDFVCLLPYEDLPPAREVRVTLQDSSQNVSAAEARAMLEAAKATLGLPGADISGSPAAIAGAGAASGAAAPEARVTAAISDLYEAALDAASAPAGAESAAAVFHVSDSQRQYLEDLVRRGECRYSPLVEGQTLPVARAGGGSVSLKVIHTEPRHTAVMVEPDTILRWG